MAFKNMERSTSGRAAGSKGLGYTEHQDYARKHTWTSAFDSINPWAKPTRNGIGAVKSQSSETGPTVPVESTPDPEQFPPYFHIMTVRQYPDDCPDLNVRWFHAVDIPERTPHMIGHDTKDEGKNTSAKAKKFSPFSQSDSENIEKRYKRLLEAASQTPLSDRVRSGTSWPIESKNLRQVPVNEDYPFNVDILERELSPAYWVGPVFKVQRGTWFFQEGASLRPCNESLAAQIEDGYLRAKPWRDPVHHSEAQQIERSVGSHEGDNEERDALPEQSHSREEFVKPGAVRKKNPLNSHRLLGSYMSSTVTYQNAHTAWLTTDTMLSWVTTSVYERFAGGGHMSGLKLIRGYTGGKVAESDSESLEFTESSEASAKELSTLTQTSPESTSRLNNIRVQSTEVHTKLRLEREISQVMDPEGRNATQNKHDTRKFMEEDIRNDYHTQIGESQSRSIEHLILVTHGIGQRLSLRMQSLNFIHDVNVLRKTLKAVYANADELRALNGESSGGPGNCRIQVLPVCWRHLVDFPENLAKCRKTILRNLGLIMMTVRHPSLEDITVEGAAFTRSLISDVALDVLLYQSSYREEISGIVVRESNRIVRLFRERNPTFDGKIHVMGHSLGSAILFDLLCQKVSQDKDSPVDPLQFSPHQHRTTRRNNSAKSFEFRVEDFYCLGSPVGLFQMLNGRTIASRKTLIETQSSVKFSNQAPREASSKNSTQSHISSPYVEQLFNIFHPSDPISYRLEPLIAPGMANVKPKALPYVKRGLFGAVGAQSITGIGTKVGQSVSGLWSSLSSGLTTGLMSNSSKGGTQRLTVPSLADDSDICTKANETGGSGVKLGMNSPTHFPAVNISSEEEPTNDFSTGIPAVASDSSIESLYSHFQKRNSTTALSPNNSERCAQHKLDMDRKKLLGLNRNGRVDYCIQEGALDFNPITTIASHIGYWADEDVNHFILSQLLSNVTSLRDQHVPRNNLKDLAAAQ